MRDDYQWDPDPKVRARNKADRAVAWLIEEFKKPDIDFRKLWLQCRSRFLYDLNTRYAEQGGAMLYNAVRDYYQHCKCLRRADQILEQSVKGVWGGDRGVTRQFEELGTAIDAQQQLLMLWSLATAQKKRGEDGDDDED